MRTTTVALDPSINSCGLAVFDSATKRLLAATRITRSKGASAKWDTLRRTHDIAGNCVAWLVSIAPESYGRADCFVSEWPEQYRPGMTKGNRNGLTPMAAVAGALAMGIAISPDLRMSYGPPLTLAHYLPKEWVQGTSKSTESFSKYVRSPRGALVLRPLDEAERLTFEATQSHDAGDAIGIGLHHLGRLKHRRVIDRS